MEKNNLELTYQTCKIECPDLSALAWEGDDLVEVTTGRRISLDGNLSERAFLLGYPFDRGLCVRNSDALWTLTYENRSTKAVLYKNWKEHRELNRSYCFAKAFDYPIALAVIIPDRAIIIHCPQSYDTLVMEDAQTGEVLGTKKTDGMEFHSRLAASCDGRFLLSAGWFWHPSGGAWLCPISEFQSSSACSANEVAFSFGSEIDAAAFLGNNHLVLSSTAEMVNEETGPTQLGPLQLGLWSIPDAKWVSITPLSQPTGAIMPWRDWVISFHGHPKAIEIDTGKVVRIWEDLDTGCQVGSIELGKPEPPPMALDPQNGRFAVCDAKGITIISLEGSD